MIKNQPKQIMFMDSPVHCVTLPQALKWVQLAISRKRPEQVLVVNANKYYQFAHNSYLRHIAAESGLVIPEWAVVWGASLIGLPPLYHVGGIDLLRGFLPIAARQGYRLYFLGARREVVERLVHRLAMDLPALEVAGYHDGYLTSPAIEQQVIADIIHSQPDALFVAMGSPHQEIWIYEHKAVLGVPVAMGVGGSFDVLAGFRKDTPGWARGKGLEWLYRLLKDPRSYGKRYLVTNTWFVSQVLKARFTAMQ